MKALIISDDKEVIKTFEEFLAKKNVEIITYSWFLKALDNIEEIKPDMLIINGEEYPRHWKILSQFAKSNIIGKKIPVFVYTTVDLNEDEENKIKLLKNTILLNSLKSDLLNKLTEKYDLSEIESDVAVGVNETVESFVSVEELDDVTAEIIVEPVEKSIDEAVVLEDNFESVDEIFEGTELSVNDVETKESSKGIETEVTEDFISSENEKVESLVSSKPIVLRALINSNVNKKIVIGNLVFNSFEDMKIKFIPDFSEDLSLFSTDSSVHDAFYEYEKDCIHFNAKVLSIKNEDEHAVELEFLE